MESRSDKGPEEVAGCIGKNFLNLGSNFVTQSFKGPKGTMEVIATAPRHNLVLAVFDLSQEARGTKIVAWLGPEKMLGQKEALATYLRGC